MSASTMHWLKISTRVIFVLVITIVGASASFAQSQSDAADLRGYVRDQQGAIVINATVTARNPATNLSRTATTNDQGLYQILNLNPGDYDVTVEMQGFKKASLPAVKLALGQRPALDITPHPGPLAPAVTIPAPSPQLSET